ncbi:MAG: GDSL-type esterase/lipase family protein [Mycobacterium sp.]
MSIYTRGVFAAVALLALAILAHNVLHFSAYVGHPSSVFVRFVSPPIVAGLMGIALLLPLELRLIIANVISAAVVSLYIGEFYLAWKLDHSQQAAAARAGSAFDARTKLSVVRDLRTAGIDAYPIIRGRNLLTEDDQGHLQPLLSVGGAPLLPLTATPRTTVVSCNETGQWLVYETDRHGFNNPDALWDGPAPQIAMIGDSFTHGSCVSRDQNMASILQRRFGATLNLGVGGDGPLLELAALTEYAEPMRPKIVLWVFCEGNDLNEDLPFELKAPILHSYLDDPRFSQDLIHKDAIISTTLRSYLDRNLREAMDRVDNPMENFVRYASLDRVRSAVGLGPILIGYNGGDLGHELAVFDQVLVSARDRVSGWGGKLYLVYLADSDRYLSRFGVGTVRQTIYHGVQDTARRRDIPMIDLASAFARHPVPETLFAYPGSHYNPAGYALAAQTIAAALDRDGTHGRDASSSLPQ